MNARWVPSVALAKEGGRASKNFAKIPRSFAPRSFIARNRLGSILERVKTNEERFVVSRKGEATAVILGYEDFLRSVLRLKVPSALRKIRESARRSGASTITPNQIALEIRAVREEKRDFTTKDTKCTKFKSNNIRTLCVLSLLR